jgi:hypothetical protein
MFISAARCDAVFAREMVERSRIFSRSRMFPCHGWMDGGQRRKSRYYSEHFNLWVFRDPCGSIGATARATIRIALQFPPILSACICAHLRFQSLADVRSASGTPKLTPLPSCLTKPWAALPTQRQRKKLEPQMHRASSNAIGHAVDFDARLAKIEQQAKPQVSRLEVIDALCGVYAIQHLHRLQFNDDGGLDQHISSIFPNDDIVVPNRDAVLLCHAETGLTQLVSQGILVDLLQKAAPKRIHNAERAPDDTLGYSVQGDSIPAHLRFPILLSDAVRESLPKR